MLQKIHKCDIFLHFLPQQNSTAAKENYLYAKNDIIAHIRASRFYIIGMPYLHHEHCLMLLLLSFRLQHYSPAWCHCL